MLVALAIATVVAEPEADANADALYYKGYYGLPYGGYYGYPYRYGYYGHPYRYGHYLGKREAEPTAEADSTVDFQLGLHGYRYVLDQSEAAAPVAAAPVAAAPVAAAPVLVHPGIYGHPAYPLPIPAVVAKPAEAPAEEETDEKKVHNIYNFFHT